MLSEHDSGDAKLRGELDALREDTRLYVKKRIGRVEKRMDKRVGKLERRIEQVELDRQHAEWRIHTNTEAMLDGLLREIRAIADLLTQSR